jgi:hypothetical protein
MKNWNVYILLLHILHYSPSDFFTFLFELQQSQWNLFWNGCGNDLITYNTGSVKGKVIPVL